jgi:hypothetical protein
MKKYFKIIAFVVLVVAAGLFWWRYYFVFGEGVKAGDLNFLVKKGYIFITWEGRLIQTGFKTTTPGALQSNEFEFSMTSDSLAVILERASGKFVELRYKEYLHPVPWRRMSKFVVTDILNIEDSKGGNPLPYN